MQKNNFYNSNNKSIIIPRGVNIASAWSWRLILIILFIYCIFRLITYVNFLFIPIAISIILSSLLHPIVSYLIRKGIFPLLSVLVIEIGLILLLFVLLIFIWKQFSLEFANLQTDILGYVEKIRFWLINGPFHITNQQIELYIEKITNIIHKNSGSILNSALSFGNAAGHIFAGTILTFFSLFFFLLEGNKIWNFILNLMPKEAKIAINFSSYKAWKALSNYARIQILVALIDGIGIGISAFVLGLPLAFPLGILVVIGSFIPVIGAFLTGMLAVLLALITKGIISGLIIFLLVILVQQIESHILQPLMMSKAVSLHPLSVVMSVMAGSVLGGMPGALLALPFLVIVNSFVRAIASKEWYKIDM